MSRRSSPRDAAAGAQSRGRGTSVGSSPFTGPRSTIPTPAELRGLDDAEVRDRVRGGRTNQAAEPSTRTLSAILRANVATRFNAVLGVLLVITLIIGPVQDATFGFTLLLNTVIGIVQEVRAKLTLDRLTVLTTPRSHVVRSSRLVEVPVEAIVIDDCVEVGVGDQIPVDGEVLAANGLALDESLLTGESEPVDKPPGSTVLSGSLVVSGTGYIRATRVGADAYARQLASEARRFTLAQSELRKGIDRLLTLGVWVMIPAGLVLVIGQFRANLHIVDAVRTSVAGMVAMVPVGLVVLTSVAFAVAAVRLGRRGVLAQELASVETLARVDVVCLDKTGTLTEAELSVERVEPVAAGGQAGEALGALAAADPRPNATLRAIARAYPASLGWQAVASVPFSSGRGWSAAAFGERGTWVLGATERLATSTPVGDRARALGQQYASAGKRVVLLARATGGLSGDVLPAGIEPAAVVVLAESVRENAAETLRYFADQGVAVKIISGDSPLTVAAVARAAGVPGADAPYDGRDLPSETESLAEVLEERSVFGRVTPHQKRAMVKALQSAGHVVAMTGDGVNDALALKDADLGIAMGSGSDATRGVAQLVLIDNDFGAVPAVVAEGRRVIANIERVTKLYITQTVYAMFLAFAIGGAGLPFPFLSRHLSLVVTFTVGIPTIVLTFAPGAQRARPGFVGRALSFAVPAGFVIALSTFFAYKLALAEPRVSLDEARTTAALVLTGIGLWLLTAIERPLTTGRRVLVGLMAAGFALAIILPSVRDYFGLVPPPPIVWLAAVGVVSLTIVVIELGWRAVDLGRALLQYLLSASSAEAASDSS